MAKFLYYQRISLWMIYISPLFFYLKTITAFLDSIKFENETGTSIERPREQQRAQDESIWLIHFAGVQIGVTLAKLDYDSLCN